MRARACVNVCVCPCVWGGLGICVLCVCVRARDDNDDNNKNDEYSGPYHSRDVRAILRNSGQCACMLEDCAEGKGREHTKAVFMRAYVHQTRGSTATRCR